MFTPTLPVTDSGISARIHALTRTAGEVVTVTLLGVNLRPTVTSVGALLGEIRATTGMSNLVASILVSVPVWCFAAGGGLAWAARRAWGTRTSVAFALCVLTASLIGRMVDGPFLLLVGTVTSCCAIAVLAALLPPIVQAASADRRVLLTTSYTVALGSGSAAGALLTPWLTAGDSWRLAGMSWALTSAAALLAWHHTKSPITGEGGMAPDQRRSGGRLTSPGVAWSLTAYLGLLSGFSFALMGWLPTLLLTCSGVSATELPWLFGLAMAIGIPVALCVPRLAGRLTNQSALVIALGLPSIVGTAGLLLAPAGAPWLWASCIGLGMPAVGLALTLIQRRAADVDSAAVLSFRTQGIGYAIAGSAVFGVGQLHDVTHGWAWPLGALLLLLAACVAAGVMASRAVTIRLLRA